MPLLSPDATTASRPSDSLRRRIRPVHSRARSCPRPGALRFAWRPVMALPSLHSPLAGNLPMSEAWRPWRSSGASANLPKPAAYGLGWFPQWFRVRGACECDRMRWRPLATERELEQDVAHVPVDGAFAPRQCHGDRTCSSSGRLPGEALPARVQSARVTTSDVPRRRVQAGELDRRAEPFEIPLSPLATPGRPRHGRPAIGRHADDIRTRAASYGTWTSRQAVHRATGASSARRMALRQRGRTACSAPSPAGIGGELLRDAFQLLNLQRALHRCRSRPA